MIARYKNFKFSRHQKLAFALVSLLLAAFGWHFLPLLFFKGFSMPPVTVSAALAKKEPYTQELASVGSLVAAQSVLLAAEVPGRVNHILFEPNQTVATDTLLLQLDDSLEKADLKKAQAQMVLADLNLKRAQKLSEGNFQAQADYDKAEAAKQSAEADVAHIQALIDKKNIKAPFSGVMGIRSINLGEFLQPGSPIASLNDLSTLYVNFDRPEKDKQLLKIGQKVLVFVDAFPEQPFHATLSAIEPKIDSDTRSLQCQATLSNKDTLLAPGMYARVRILLPQNQMVITVPETAIDYGLYGSSIFMIERSFDKKTQEPVMTVKRHYVKVGERRDNRAIITEGISESDQVVTSGQVKLHDGTSVVIDETSTLNIPQKQTNS